MSHNLSAYLKTKVPHYRTQEVITGLLEKRGIDEIRFTQKSNQIVLEFNYPENIQGKTVKLGVQFRMDIPPADSDKERAQLRNQRYRALYYVLKSKLEAVEFGIREFGEEFLGDLVYALPSGSNSTISQIIGPQLQKALLEGKSEVLMLEDRT